MVQTPNVGTANRVNYPSFISLQIIDGDSHIWVCYCGSNHRYLQCYYHELADADYVAVISTDIISCDILAKPQNGSKALRCKLSLPPTRHTTIDSKLKATHINTCELILIYYYE